MFSRRQFGLSFIGAAISSILPQKMVEALQSVPSVPVETETKVTIEDVESIGGFEYERHGRNCLVMPCRCAKFHDISCEKADYVKPPSIQIAAFPSWKRSNPKVDEGTKRAMHAIATEEHLNAEILKAEFYYRFGIPPTEIMVRRTTIKDIRCDLSPVREGIIFYREVSLVAFGTGSRPSHKLYTIH